MLDKLIAAGHALVAAVPESERTGWPEFDPKDPEMRVSYAFGGLANMIDKYDCPLEASFDQLPSGVIAISMNPIVGIRRPPPMAKSGESILRGVVWEIPFIDKMDQQGAFAVNRTDTVQVAGAVFVRQRRSQGFVGQRYKHITTNGRKTPDQLIQDFTDVAVRFLPNTKYARAFKAELGL